jgi:integrase
MGSVKAPYLVRKRGIYYVRKRIPKPLISRYGRAFVQKSLGTSDRASAVRISSNIVVALEKEWQEILFELPKQGSVVEFLTSKATDEPCLSEACTFYCSMKGKLDNKRFVRLSTRIVSEIVVLSGDKSISAYTRTDAIGFRDQLLKRNASYGTVKRNFECIRAIWNFSARENGINTPNPFANMNYGNGAPPIKRKPVPADAIHSVQRLCRQKDDDIRWLIALLSDSGMRLSEAVGLHVTDVDADALIPFVRLVAHPRRQLKTNGSERCVPLIGESLWAAKRAISKTDNGFVFPRYCSEQECKSDYASNSLNKWLKQYVPKGCVIHSFRHSLRDRLRAVQCPSDIIDQIGGWQTAGVGQGYGKGYELDILYEWMCKIL